MKPYFQTRSANEFYLNNVKTTLALSLSDTATNLVTEDPITFPTIAKPVNQEWGWGFPLTLSDGTNSEIVYVTGVTNGTTLTIVRGQEETAPRAFAAGASAECRLTAGTLAALSNQCEYAYEGSIVIGEFAEAHQNTWDSIAIGHRAQIKHLSLSAGGSIVLGNYAYTQSEGTVVVGEYATIQPGFGEADDAQSNDAVAVGAYASIKGQSPGTVAVGAYAWATAPGAIAVGSTAEGAAENSIALGNVIANVEGGMAVSALPYIPAAAGAKSMQTVIATSVIDLSSGAASVTLDMPANSIMLIDSLDWITTASDTPGGTPQIQVGTDETDNATLLAASEITATGLHQRQTFEPLHSNGVTSVHVSVATAGTGTLTGKLVVRGYVMEV